MTKAEKRKAEKRKAKRMGWAVDETTRRIGAFESIVLRHATCPPLDVHAGQERLLDRTEALAERLHPDLAGRAPEILALAVSRN